MIKRLELENFKCFKKLSLPFSNLTALTGFNASGKTSTLQSLLLLSQNFRENRPDGKVTLNGKSIRLGTPGDVLNEDSDTNIIRIDVEDESACIKLALGLDNRNSDRTIDIKSLTVETGDNKEDFFSTSQLFSKLSQLDSPNLLYKSISNIDYLGISRLELDSLYPISDSSTSHHVGTKGEFAPWLFEVFKDDMVHQDKMHPDEVASNFRRQFNAWFGDIFPNAEADTLSIDNTNFVKLMFRNNKVSEWRTPSNIGYGLSYAFPIVVSALLAKPGDIIIIDSPEAHLHPQGQSKMGEFLSIMSSAGVQIIIETHSDHMLNGIRLAVYRTLIDRKEISIHFFNSTHSDIISPFVDENGNLSEWPEGFFDQAEKDMSELVGW
jgi:predicted ATPase